ncbi:MAG: integrase [Magnetococcales bacterium]|nr:integrase [Magnetococcales bacterium]
MTTMISGVYEAFRDAGITDEKARKVAEVLSLETTITKNDVRGLERRLDVIDGEIKLVKWMLALVIAAEVLPIIKAIFAQ